MADHQQIHFVAEFGVKIFEPAAREGGRAVALQIGGEKIEEFAELIHAMLGAQAGFFGLANHVARVAGQFLQIGFVIGGKLGGEGDVERILMETLERLALAFAQFQEINIRGAGRFGGVIEQGAARDFVRGADSAVHSERNGIQNAANHPVGNGKKREDARNFSVTLGENVARLVAESFLHRAHPAGEVKG